MFYLPYFNGLRNKFNGNELVNILNIRCNKRNIGFDGGLNIIWSRNTYVNAPDNDVF
jgi:hypothetical protein